ncbi:MAG TPA: hypothetical protein VMW27_18925 [Thermoanaerobaculia bacterium]|nr:hypothetical protein [Thermoanaerobaculia bacterium]
MKHRATSLRLIPLLAAWTLFAAAELRAQLVLDPQPDYEELRAEAAVHPDGDVLLTWTREQEPGVDWSVMAATLDPNTGQLGELHEWGPGGAEKVVPLGSGYLAVRQNVDPNPEWFVQQLDETGEPVGAAYPFGFILSVAAHAMPDGTAVVIVGGAGGAGGTLRAWRFAPDGGLIAGAVPLADSSSTAAVGVDGAGNLVLAWTDRVAGLVVRRFSPDLQPLGPAVQVARAGGSGLRVAVAPDGRFVVVFIQAYQLQARAFHADGTPASGRIPISPRRDLVVMQEDFSVATGPDGEILVVWKTYVNGVPTIQARFLSLNGRPSTPLLRLAKVPLGRNVLSPRVETLPEGDFLVVWTQVVDTAGDRLILRSRRFSH